MGIMINGKKVAGMMIGGKKIAGAAYGGKVVYRLGRFLPNPVQLWQWSAGSAVNSVAVNDQATAATAVYAGDNGGNLNRLYSESGQKAWSNNSNKLVSKIVTDNSSSVYTLDNVRKIVSSFYDMGFVAGNRWSINLDNYAGGIALDTLGTLYVTSNSGDLLKLSTDNGSQTGKIAISHNALGAVTTDSQNNVYLDNGQSAVVKLDSSGNGQWQQSLYGTPVGLTLDSQDNLYIGDSSGLATKMDSNGNEIWQWGTSSGIFAIAVDSQFNVYVGGDDKHVTKLDSTGKKLWQWTAPGTVNSIATDSQFNVYVGDKSGYVTKLQTAK